MSRYRGPKARLCRSYGLDLFGRPKYGKILEKRPNPPGHVGAQGGRGGKKSGFAIQLREKQKLRLMFGLTEKQFKRTFDEAIRMQGVTADNLMKLLETRLDNVLYRGGLALTRFQARQLASHGHFLVNGRRVNIPSYRVCIGDKVELRPKLKNSKLYPGILEENKGYKPARWLKVQVKDLALEMAGEPASDDFEQIVDTQKIVEYYSR
ncbi:MAG: 30S ribosomal protein S4 [bacterium]|nr:30S ribosomal protein S4 [bacterium]